MNQSAIANRKSAIPLWHRLPKWLVDERFEIAHSPALEQPISVVLFDKVSRRYQGHGQSLARAAKDALKKRDASEHVTSHTSLVTSSK